MKFSALNIDFSSPSPNSLSSRKLVNISDLELPKFGDFREFFVILDCYTHFKSELHQNG